LSAVTGYGETIHRSYRSRISRICRNRNGRKEGVVKREDEEKKWKQEGPNTQVRGKEGVKGESHEKNILYAYKQIKTFCWYAAVFKIAFLPLIFTCFSSVKKKLLTNY
jgi:hypothetical protein